MKTALVTGSAGLVGQSCVRKLCRLGYKVIGFDNDFRKFLFGEEASTRHAIQHLGSEFPNYQHYDLDIRDSQKVSKVVKSNRIDLIIHAAAQPSHDWAKNDPITDFEINANGTLILLEQLRHNCPEATFVFVSTNKVYGDYPNRLSLVEEETRLTPLNVKDSLINEQTPIDQSMHSLFGVSKTSADLLTQEYGRYFNLNTACFRCGCITGREHSGVKLHGFLSYLIKCLKDKKPYEIIGYKGKQVRDNIHADDLVEAFIEFHRSPKSAKVYNIGGGIKNNCSVIEAVKLAEKSFGITPMLSYNDKPRLGDHKWYVSDLTSFKTDYPNWDIRITLEDIFNEYRD